MQLPTIPEASPGKPVGRRLSLGVNVPLDERPNRIPEAYREKPSKPRPKTSSSFMDCRYPYETASLLTQAISLASMCPGGNSKSKSNRRYSSDASSTKRSSMVLEEPRRKKQKKEESSRLSTKAVPNRHQSIPNSQRRRSIGTNAPKVVNRRQSRAYEPEETALPSYARPTLSSKKQSVWNKDIN